MGLTDIDLRKIEIVYGPECLKRDRQEKIELCQSFPGVARKKREISFETQSLRVNPEITAPPRTETAKTLHENLKDLGIENQVQEIIDSAYKVSSLALKNAREKYCNGTKSSLRTDVFKSLNKSSDILGIVEVIADYAKSVVDHALTNLTAFCEDSESFETYLRMNCQSDDGIGRCRQTYRSTKSGLVRHSTQHRPTYYQSTNLPRIKKQFVQFGRMGNNGTEESDSTVSNKDDETKAITDKVINIGVSKPTVRSKRHLERDSIVRRLEHLRKESHRRGNRDSVRSKIVKKRDVQEKSIPPKVDGVKHNKTEDKVKSEKNTSNEFVGMRSTMNVEEKED